MVLKNAPDIQPEDIEAKILEQIRALIQRRQEIDAEENALRRLLIKVRSETVKAQDVTRKNSATRILIEDRILETLRRAPEGVSTSVLAREVAYYFPRIKGATFRSYLHRLSVRGLVEPAQGRLASWQLSKTARERSGISD